MSDPVLIITTVIATVIALAGGLILWVAWAALKASLQRVVWLEKHHPDIHAEMEKACRNV